MVPGSKFLVPGSWFLVLGSKIDEYNVYDFGEEVKEKVFGRFNAKAAKGARRRLPGGIGRLVGAGWFKRREGKGAETQRLSR